MEEAISQAEDIISMADEVPDAGQDFAQSVVESVHEVLETMERTGRVTAKQQEALDNWQRGIEAWIHE